MPVSKETFMRTSTASRIAEAALLLLALTFAPRSAHAAVTGAIEGTVTDQASGKWLAGITVTVTSPRCSANRPSSPTSRTLHHHRLPPGEYMVRFYFATRTWSGRRVRAGPTRRWRSRRVPTQQASVKDLRSFTRRPQRRRSATAQVQTQVTQELVRNTPVRAAATTPCSRWRPRGGGRHRLFIQRRQRQREHYLIDGLNTTNGAFGIIGSQLSLEFIGETEIVTGGYNAEYGAPRRRGSTDHQSGSNEFHGGIWFYGTPVG